MEIKKRITIPWSDKEKDYLIKRVVKDMVHPSDFQLELNEKFGFKRTYSAIKTKLRDLGVSYVGLLTEKQKQKEKPPEIKAFTEEDMRKHLSKIGYKVEKIEEEKIDKKFKVDTSMFKGEKIKFGVLSCSQLGSKYQQLTYLRNFYQYASDKGCGFMLHCGDLVDGIDVYKGHEFELFLHGAKAQKDYAIEYYPKLENGGKTYVIQGNHDHSFVKKAGINVLEDIAKEREDIIYCGTFGAYPKIPNLKTYMQHGDGGVSYARSYKIQRIIEQFSPDAKPDIWFVGHWHVSCALFEYRNVIAFMIPCFQSQTPYLRKKGLYPEIGGLIIEFAVNDAFRKGGIAGMNFSWIPFYVPKTHDY